MTESARRVLSLEQALARIDRYADAWASGRDVPQDPELEEWLRANGYDTIRGAFDVQSLFGQRGRL